MTSEDDTADSSSQGRIESAMTTAVDRFHAKKCGGKVGLVDRRGALKVSASGRDIEKNRKSKEIAQKIQTSIKLLEDAGFQGLDARVKTEKVENAEESLAKRRRAAASSSTHQNLTIPDEGGRQEQ